MEWRDLDGIAVIGMSGRFPGAGDPATFWDNLAAGRDACTALSERQLRETFSRFDLDPAFLARPDYVRAAYMLDGVEHFDAAFFGFSRREASLIDPQHRLFLECAWETLESAGYPPGSSGPRIGVFAGSALSQYLMANLYHHVDFSGASNPLLNLLGNDKDYLTTRTSYKLDLTGPSVAVQTACSTSLVAVATACDSLWDHQCDLALAGGVTVMVPQAIGYVYEEGNVHSPDGRCRAFDARAGGTVFGSGVGLVALRRLEDALADGDRILAVIRGAAVNNDGSTKVGYTAPNEAAQAEVIATALARAEVPADTIGYVEAHGTGTQLGDPIEVAALTRVFRRSSSRTGYCALGSVKTNVGHLQAAAGIASLIKTVLAIEHRRIPPSLHFETPNPAIDFDSSPFYVNTELAPWRSNGGPLRAGVSSFGMGGTNAHVILEEPPERPREGPARNGVHLLTLSAKSQQALRELARRTARHLAADGAPALADVCFTASCGRVHHRHRLAVPAADRAALAGRLEALAGDAGEPAGGAGESPPAVGFAVGPGDLAAAGGAEGLLAEPAFREAVERCERVLGPRLEGPALASPRFAPFVLPWALARLWESWGVTAAAVLGHGAGELVAGCVAGILSLEEALDLLAGGDAARPPRRPPRVPLLTADGATTAGEVADGRWSCRAADPAVLRERLRDLERAGCDVLLEIGPRSQPVGSEAGTAPDAPRLAGWGAGGPTREELLEALGGLYRRGATIDWPAVHAGSPRPRRVLLPGHPWSRQRCWLDPVPGRHPIGAAAENARRPLLGRPLHLAEARERRFESRVGPHEPAFLGDHRIAGTPVFPAAGFWAMALAAAEGAGGAAAIVETAIEEPLLFSGPELRTLQTLLAPDTAGGESFRIHSLEPAPGEGGTIWRRHATGRVPDAAAPAAADPVDLEALRGALPEAVAAEDFYRFCRERGAEHGPAFLVLTGLRRGGSEALGTVELPAELHAEAGRYPIHPALLDGCLQLAAAALDGGGDGATAIRIPSALDRLTVHRAPGTRLTAHARRQAAGGAGEETVRLTAYDPSGRPAVTAEGLRFVAVSPRSWAHRETPPPAAARPDPAPASPRLPRPAGPWRLRLGAYGSPEHLVLEPAGRRPPGPREVEVEVRAAGLNFKDVLLTLGALEAEGTEPVGDLALGSEAAGRVVAVGEEVQGVAPGDGVVVALAPGCLASHVTVPAAVVVAKPEGVSWEAAAALPVAWLTAHHALVTLARLAPGERVLIHAAAGGVGQAAVRIASRIGAEVFATASPAKWEFVRAAGVEHVFGSRDAHRRPRRRRRAQQSDRSAARRRGRGAGAGGPLRRDRPRRRRGARAAAAAAARRRVLRVRPRPGGGRGPRAARLDDRGAPGRAGPHGGGTSAPPDVPDRGGDRRLPPDDPRRPHRQGGALDHGCRRRAGRIRRARARRRGRRGTGRRRPPSRGGAGAAAPRPRGAGRRAPRAARGLRARPGAAGARPAALGAGPGGADPV
jgi:acyl transferase domain-containing protein